MRSLQYIVKGNGTNLQAAAIDGAEALIRFANLKNVKVINGQVNPYTSKINDSNVPDDYIKVSALGTPIYSNLVIGAGSFVDNQGVTQSWSDITIDDILMTISQQKKIVVTEIQGKDNDVKEYIGMRDFQIDLTGAIFGGYNQYPAQAAKDLKTALSAPQPLVLASSWLQNFGITDAVVFTFEFPETEGEYSTQYFTAMLKSDVPVEVRITG